MSVSTLFVKRGGGDESIGKDLTSCKHVSITNDCALLNFYCDQNSK